MSERTKHHSGREDGVRAAGALLVGIIVSLALMAAAPAFAGPVPVLEPQPSEAWRDAFAASLGRLLALTLAGVFVFGATVGYALPRLWRLRPPQRPRPVEDDA